MRALVFLAGLAMLGLKPEDPGYLRGEPAGQSGCYRIDHDVTRTMSLVQAGFGTLNIGELVPLAGRGFIYPVDVFFRIEVTLFGTKRALVPFSFPVEYFRPQFLPLLRKVKHFDADLMKMDHLGIETVQMEDGRVFKDADHLAVYDIDLSRNAAAADSVVPLLRALAAADRGEPPPPEPQEPPTRYLQEVRNLRADVYVRPGLPALGVVKLALTGDAFGLNFRLGFEHTDDPLVCAAQQGDAS